MLRNTIKRILREDISRINEKTLIKMLEMLSKAGFTNKSSYKDILKYINNNLAIFGIEAFELFQLFKDNYNIDLEKEDLHYSDVKSKVIRTSNISGRDLVISRIPFKGSNTHGEYINNNYVVFSYKWYPVFLFKDGQWFENENKYSVSTAKQMSQLRPYNQGDIIKISKDKMWEIINK